MKLILACLITFATGGSALAGFDPYVALGAEIGEYETDNPSNQYGDSFDAGKYTDFALNGRLGVDMGPTLGVELGVEFEGAIYLGGAAEYSAMDEDGIGGFEAQNDAKSRLLLFLRGGAHVSDKVKLYARAGLGQTKRQNRYRSYGIYQFDGTLRDVTRTSERSSVAGALGLGVEYTPNSEGKSAIRADLTYYSSYIGGEDQNLDSANDKVISVAYVRRF